MSIYVKLLSFTLEKPLLIWLGVYLYEGICVRTSVITTNFLPLTLRFKASAMVKCRELLILFWYKRLLIRTVVQEHVKVISILNYFRHIHLHREILTPFSMLTHLATHKYSVRKRKGKRHEIIFPINCDKSSESV